MLSGIMLAICVAAATPDDKPGQSPGNASAKAAAPAAMSAERKAALQSTLARRKAYRQRHRGSAARQINASLPAWQDLMRQSAVTSGSSFTDEAWRATAALASDA
jgi:hypothetical protein